jgi:hypothetical protein
MPRKPAPQVRVEALVVGFYLHERTWHDQRSRYDGCGGVAFWTTEHPNPPRLVTDADLEMNGQRKQSSLIGWTQPPKEWVECVTCGSYVHLHVKRYRAIPRVGDVVRTYAHRRAMEIA